MSSRLVLLRHGQSVWNLENKFTGWVDVDLSAQGVQEAETAGEKIKKTGIQFAVAHTSRLKRAQRTLDIVLKTMGVEHLPIVEDSALNERHYGELQGLNKDEMRKKFGDEQVHIWRRSFDIPPPGGESLADCAKRSLPYFREYIQKPLLEGQSILVVAHGNSLRSIIMEIEKMSPEQILALNLETGVPLVYTFEKGDPQFRSKETI
jgi:2,3-bisphosphoglycerate-dependent phosphoglycerate mutase